jgi:hypothetical protein
MDIASILPTDIVPSYTNKHRKSLFDKINILSSTEHEEILKIVKGHNVTYSQNKNGIFFNLSSIPDIVVRDIDNFVSYCISNKKELDEYDKIINECKMNNCINNIIPAINTSLGNMGKIQIEEKDSWANVKVDDVTVDKFVKFVDKVNQDKDKIGRKKLNLKFNNAKKRFSKKNERKIDADVLDDLKEEEYLIKQGY